MKLFHRISATATALVMTANAMSIGFSATAAVPDGDVVIRMAYSTDKILQDRTYSDDELLQNFALTAFKNEYESGQLILTAVNQVSAYSVKVNDFVSGVNTLSADCFSLYQEYYHTVDTIFDEESTMPAGMYPDALLPMDTAVQQGLNTVAAGDNQGVWVSVKVPSAQAAGVYAGSFDVTINGSVYRVPATVTVIDYTLPDTVSLKSSIGIQSAYMFNSELDDTQEMYQKHVDLLNEFRLSGLYLSDRQASGIHDAYEKARYDAGLALDYTAKPSCASYAIRVYAQADDTYGMSLNETMFMEYLKAYIDVSLEHGVDLFEKAFVYMGNICDEPEISDTVDRAQYCAAQYQSCISAAATYLDGKTGDATFKTSMRQHLVSMSNLITARNNSGLSNFNTFCPMVSYLDSSTSQADYLAMHSQGKDYWWYTCTTPKIPYPTLHVDDNAISSRVMGWMAKEYDVSGYLTWEMIFNVDYAGYTAKPLYGQQLYDQVLRWPDAYGDGFLVYPGKLYGLDKPVASLRLHTIRDGLEDYEALRDLENTYQALGSLYGIQNLSAGSVLSVLYNKLYSGTRCYTSSEELVQVKQCLAELLVLAKKQQTAVTDLEIENGKVTISVAVPDGASVSVMGTALTSYTTVTGGKLYTTTVNLSAGDNSQFMIQAGSGSVTLDLGGGAAVPDTFSSSSSKFSRNIADILNISFSNTTYIGEAVTRVKLSNKTSYEFSYQTASNAITQNTERLLMAVYNSSSRRVAVSLLLNGSVLADTVYLQPGKNLLHFDRINNLNWTALGTVNKLTFKVTDSVNDGLSLYFDSLTTINKSVVNVPQSAAAIELVSQGVAESRLQPSNTILQSSDPLTHKLHSFETIGELYTLRYTGSFGRASLNTDPSFITDGNASQKLEIYGDYRDTDNGYNPVMSILLQDYAEYAYPDFSRVNAVTWDMFNESSGDQELMVSLSYRKDGEVKQTGYTRYVLRTGYNALSYQMDGVSMSYDADILQNMVSINFRFNKLGALQDTAPVFYVDNMALKLNATMHHPLFTSNNGTITLDNTQAHGNDGFSVRFSNGNSSSWSAVTIDDSAFRSTITADDTVEFWVYLEPTEDSNWQDILFSIIPASSASYLRSKQVLPRNSWVKISLTASQMGKYITANDGLRLCLETLSGSNTSYHLYIDDFRLIPGREKTDKTALTTACGWMDEYQEGEYAPSGWNLFTLALETAQSMLNNPDATQAEIDSAASALQYAANCLVKVNGQRTITLIQGEQDIAAWTFSSGTALSGQSITLQIAAKNAFVVPAGALYAVIDGTETQCINADGAAFTWTVPVYTSSLTVTAKFFATVLDNVTTFGSSKRQPEGDTTTKSPQALQSGLQFGSVVYHAATVAGTVYSCQSSGTILIQGNGLGGYSQQQWYDVLDGVTGAVRIGNLVGLKKTRTTYQAVTGAYTQYAVRISGLAESNKQTQVYTAFGYALYSNGEQTVVRFSEPKISSYDSTAQQDDDLLAQSTVISKALVTRQTTITRGSGEAIRVYSPIKSDWPRTDFTFASVQDLSAVTDLTFDIKYAGLHPWCSVRLLDSNGNPIGKEIGRDSLQDWTTVTIPIADFGCTYSELQTVKGVRIVLNMEDYFNANTDGTGYASAYFDNMRWIRAKDSDIASTAKVTSAVLVSRQTAVSRNSSEALRLYTGTAGGWPSVYMEFPAVRDLNTSVNLQFDAKFVGMYPWCSVTLLDENMNLISREVGRDTSQDWSTISIPMANFGCTAEQLRHVKGIRIAMDTESSFNPQADGTGYASLYLDNMRFMQSKDGDLIGTARVITSLSVSQQAAVTLNSREALRLYSSVGGWPSANLEFSAIQNLTAVSVLQFDAKFVGMHTWCSLNLMDENMNLIGGEIGRDFSQDWGTITVPITDFGCTQSQLSRVKGIRMVLNMENNFNPNVDGTGYASTYFDNMKLIQTPDADLLGMARVTSSLPAFKQSSVTNNSQEALCVRSAVSGWPTVFIHFSNTQNVSATANLQFDAKFIGLHTWCSVYLLDENGNLMGTEVGRDSTAEWGTVTVPLSAFGCTDTQLSKVKGIRLVLNMENNFYPDADGTGFAKAYFDNLRIVG